MVLVHLAHACFDDSKNGSTPVEGDRDALVKCYNLGSKIWPRSAITYFKSSSVKRDLILQVDIEKRCSTPTRVASRQPWRDPCAEGAWGSDKKRPLLRASWEAKNDRVLSENC